MSLGGGGMLVPQRQKGICCDTCWGTFCGIGCGTCWVSTVIGVPCLVVMPFVGVVVGIPLSVVCETTYVIFVVEVSIGVVVALVFVVIIVVGTQFFSQGIIDIPTIV